jgi:SP family myo-inositol transporter-like MFS transporter 13
MVFGRAVVGIAVGSASFVVPLYVSELAPARWRGRLVTIVALLITGGQVGAYVVGWLFSRMPHGWKWMVGLGAVPALVQVLTMVGMPETPRWLVKAGRVERARAVLRKVFGEDEEEVVTVVMARVEREIEEEDAAVAKTGRFEGELDGLSMRLRRMKENFSELITVPGHLRALIITCMLQGAQQLCGFVCSLLSARDTLLEADFP